MKAPSFKPASLGFVTPKKRVVKLNVMKKAAPKKVAKKLAPYPTRNNKSVSKNK